MGIKTGANTTDQKNIRILVEKGHTSEEISTILRISHSCVKSFMPETAEESAQKEIDDEFDD